MSLELLTIGIICLHFKLHEIYLLTKERNRQERELTQQERAYDDLLEKINNSDYLEAIPFDIDCE
ncbi:7672_t:CDS:2, partial [Gigaspora margarita]